MRWNDHWMEDAVKEAPSIHSYISALREAVDQLSQKMLRRCWNEHYRTPGAYIDELLGMEYLYSQTGKELTPVLQNPEEDRLVEEVNDEDFQDKGFVEESMEDITFPVLYEDDPSCALQSRLSSLTSPQASPPPPSPAQPSSPPPSSHLPYQPLPSSPQAPASPADVPSSSMSDEARGAVIGPDGIAWWDKVQDLAVYLVDLVRLLTSLTCR
ncbi:uncharacterized protein AB9X84_002750 isoform 2-T6 [Acanthopagrus schlegelii]